MLTNLTFASLFALNVGLVIYLSINEKMHAQPWRLFSLAFIAISITFWLQSSIDGAATLLDKLDPGKSHFDDVKQALSLINTIVGAFSGALIGTAVTNKAMYLNSKRLKELSTRREQLKDKRARADEIKNELANSQNSFSREDFLKKHELRSQLLTEYIDEMQDIEDEESQLSL